MIKKKLLFTLLGISGTAVVAGGIAAGFVMNSEQNRYRRYYTAPQSASTNDLIQAYFAAIVNGSKLLYLASYAHTTPITNALCLTEQQNSIFYDYFSRAGYLLIDDVYGFPLFLSTDDENNGLIDTSKLQPFWSTNLASAQFRSDLGSFITGIAMAEFLNENRDYFGDNLSWSTYGGFPFPSVTSFMGGFQKGVEFFNAKILPKMSAYDYKEVTQKFIGTGENQNFAHSFDPNGGIDIIESFLSNKSSAPSVFIPVAGGQVQQAVRKVKQNSLKTIIIGVDSPVEDDDTINLPLPSLSNGETVGNNKIVQFSSTKNINVIVDKITAKLNDGTIGAENDIAGLGWSSLGTLDNGGVGVSPAGQKYFIKAIQLLNNPQNPNDIVIDENNLETQYLNALKDLTIQSTLKELDKPENKVFSIGKGGFSYAAIPNEAQEMIPISSGSAPEDMDEIRNWYESLYANDPTILKQIDKNMTIIEDWRKSNWDGIQKRKSFTLKNQLTKEAYEKNKGLIKMIFQDSFSVLFDHSFLQSCYEGLRAYWKSKNVNLPAAIGSTK
ncbi:MAG: BMP family ABC transporter substrate-binding protein [Ureaplasma sp.]|nr:BMP family ABC transporter substrate-binding protein [Ureaplasma sp.]